MTFLMSGLSGSGAIRTPHDERRSVAMWIAVLAVLTLAYFGSLRALHGLVGNAAFLFGLVICLVAAAGLGIRGALVVIVSISLIDRSFVFSLPLSPDTGRTAAVMSLLVKLVLAGGLGWMVDSRRRERALNDELHREIAARERSEQSLRRSESMQRALVESLGEGVGLFDAQDRVVYANQALAETLGTTRDALTTKTFSEFLTEPAGARRCDTTRRRATLLRDCAGAQLQHAIGGYRNAPRSERLAR